MYRRAWATLFLSSLAAALTILSGCEAVTLPGGDAAARQSEPSACLIAPEPADAGTVIVLVWDGGLSRQTGSRELAAFNAYALSYADTSAEDADLEARFRAAVLARVQLILCDLEPADVTVVAGDADSYRLATRVHITGDAPLGGGKHIGQSDFDACNERPDDAAVIWGGALAARIPPLRFEQWVNVVANTTAHEIGHTLGFTHPSEETVAQMLPVPAIEIMRSNVKPSELAGEQAFVLPQQTCPGHEPGEGSYASAASVAIDD